jgi:positive phototaxis protein PixI
VVAVRIYKKSNTTSAHFPKFKIMSGVILPTRQERNRSLGDPFLRLRLDPKTTAVIPMQETREAIVLDASRVTPIPNLPSAILGTIDRRSRLLWLVDLPEILGLTPLDRQRNTYDVAVIEARGNTLAIATDKIEGTTRFPRADIRSPVGNFNPEFTPYLRGWILQAQEVILVLDPEAIINSHSIVSG